jgi:hypothetical protein
MSRKLIDLTGQKFGRLIVIKKVDSNMWHHPRWLCRCDCGKEKIMQGANLRNGKTKSCGCLHKEAIGKRVRLNLGIASMKAAMKVYKNSAKIRGYNFNLTEKQFVEITKRDCYYCGAKPNNISYQNKYYGDYIYNGIDRIDSMKGYILDNVVSCCKICNYAKRSMTTQEFKDWIKRVYNKIFIT